MDKARSMLSGVGLAQESWVEAVQTTRYLVNMSHSSVSVEMTPNGVRSSKNPSLAHLKVFGCDAFVHVPKEKRSKLQKKEVKCIFIRYKEGMKGYKLWDLASRRKWVFKKNMNVVGQVEKFKYRLVENGYFQVNGVHFGDIFSPVVKLTYVRVVMSLAAKFDMEIESMDVMKTFLHGDLE
jgi:hypothetical protein